MNIPDKIDYSLKEKQSKTESDLKELRTLYETREEVVFDNKSEFEKKVLSLKTKLFSEVVLEEKKFEEIISFLRWKIVDFSFELSLLEKAEDYRKEKWNFYNYETLIDEKKFYYEYSIKNLEKLCVLIEEDFKEFWCVFFSEKEIEKILYKIESYCEKSARISKILFVASMNWDTEVMHYDFDEYMDEKAEFEKQKDITKK